MITYFRDLIQGSDEWFQARLGILTASEMKLIITAKTLKYASNEKEKTHLYELTAQKITKYIEPSYISDDMLRGQDDESIARETYHEKYDKVETCGFIINDKFGFPLGYSPDGLVGEDGQIECKSRRQKYQIETILTDTVPEEHILQVQTGLIVTERKWCDYISYSGGLPMTTIRMYSDVFIQGAIIDAATIFYSKMNDFLVKYENRLEDPKGRLIPTERTIDKGMRSCL